MNTMKEHTSISRFPSTKEYWEVIRLIKEGHHPLDREVLTVIKTSNNKSLLWGAVAAELVEKGFEITEDAVQECLNRAGRHPNILRYVAMVAENFGNYIPGHPEVIRLYEEADQV